MKFNFRRFILMLFFICAQIVICQAQEKTGSGRDSEPPREVKPQRSEESSKMIVKDPNALSEPAKQAVTDEIKSQLATMASKQLMELVAFCKKNEIVGDFIVDLTVERKGRVVTVRMVSGPEIPVTKKNMLQDKLGELQFDNVSIPKKQRVKQRYTLTF